MIMIFMITSKIIWIFQVRVSRLYRDLRLWSIGGGADEVKSFPDVFCILFCFHLFSFHFLQMFFVFLICKECFSNVPEKLPFPFAFSNQLWTIPFRWCWESFARWWTFCQKRSEMHDIKKVYNKYFIKYIIIKD